MTFEEALPTVLRFEGGYVNDPVDPGGATNKGITQATYDRARDAAKLPRQPVLRISDDEVKLIYERDYWKPASCDVLVQTKPKTALVHFDSAVNCGVKQAAKFLQRAINTKNIDGVIGRQTLRDLSAFSDIQACRAYLDQREQFYGRLVEQRPTLAKFLRGWLLRIKKLRQLTLPPETYNA